MTELYTLSFPATSQQLDVMFAAKVGTQTVSNRFEI